MSASTIELINSNVGLYFFGVMHGMIICMIASCIYSFIDIISYYRKKKKQLKEELEEREKK